MRNSLGKPAVRPSTTPFGASASAKIRTPADGRAFRSQKQGPAWTVQAKEEREIVELFVRRDPDAGATWPELWQLTITAEDREAEAFEIRLWQLSRWIEDESRGQC
jgi:hypothetical protein